jgi:SET domain
MSPNTITVSTHGHVALLRTPATGHALRSYDAGEVIQAFTAGSVHEAPTYITVQRGEKEHLTLQPALLQRCNHSCHPNGFFDTDAMNFIAIAPVHAGEELTFFYPSSEWKMAQAFECCCGAAGCLGKIEGAYCLPDTLLAQYRLTAFIRKQVQARHRIL